MWNLLVTKSIEINKSMTHFKIITTSRSYRVSQYCTKISKYCTEYLKHVSTEQLHLYSEIIKMHQNVDLYNKKWAKYTSSIILDW